MSSVVFEGVYFSYANRKYIFEDLSLSFEDYGITCIVSDPGKGKSTLLKLIKGILKPTRGRIVVLDIDLSNATKSTLIKLHSRVSIHFQDTFLISNADVYSNLTLPLLYNTSLSKREIDYEVDKALDLFGIKNIKYEMSFELSPTEAKLVSLSRAFLNNPRLVLLDEPFALLDSYYRARLLEVIEEFKGKSKIIFTTSEEVLAMSSESVLYVLSIENSKKIYYIHKSGDLLEE
ncbi:MAG: energy-coupling factor ABC transporter ATP-binding protein [Brevinematales bacterium]|nr:energy-coupling factor ABC transporter ATP-binding protein [Brevinematales bacterium]